MVRALPPLNSLRAFEAVGRRGSLTKAARELSVSISAISRHVALLEAHVGEPLLQRVRTGVVPTARGRAYLAAAGEAFDRIEAVGRPPVHGGASPPLRLAIYPTMTTEWLAPRLKDLSKAHPGIQLDVIVSRPGTPASDDADLWVTAFAEEVGNHPSTVLFETLATLVCTPALRDGPPPIRTVADLDRHTLLHAPRERLLWDELLRTLQAPRLADFRTMRFDTLGLTFQAARGGGGIALANPLFVVEDLRSGRLVLPFETVLTFDVPHYLVRHRSRIDDPAVTAAYRWLLNQANATTAALAPLLSCCKFSDAHVRHGRVKI